MTAVFVILDITDDFRYILITLHTSFAILFLIVWCMIIVPIAMFIDVMTLPTKEFIIISQMSPTIRNRFRFFLLEYLSLLVFVTDSRESIYRSK